MDVSSDDDDTAEGSVASKNGSLYFRTLGLNPMAFALKHMIVTCTEFQIQSSRIINGGLRRNFQEIQAFLLTIESSKILYYLHRR